MQTSFVPDPQWLATIRQAIQQRGAQSRAAAQQQANAFSAQLRQQGQALAGTMQGRQNAYITMMGEQEADRNNTFNDHMRDKAWGQFNEMYINDEHCLWNDAHTVCVRGHS